MPKLAANDDDDDEPNPASAILMQIVDRLPPGFRELVYKYDLETVLDFLPYVQVKGPGVFIGRNDQKSEMGDEWRPCVQHYVPKNYDPGRIERQIVDKLELRERRLERAVLYDMPLEQICEMEELNAEYKKRKAAEAEWRANEEKEKKEWQEGINRLLAERERERVKQKRQEKLAEERQEANAAMDRFIQKLSKGNGANKPSNFKRRI